MKGILIIVLASSGWSSNSVYRSEFPDLAQCIDAMRAMRVEHPKTGDRNAVTAIIYCTTDPKGQDAQASYFHDVPPEKRGHR